MVIYKIITETAPSKFDSSDALFYSFTIPVGIVIALEVRMIYRPLSSVSRWVLLALWTFFSVACSAYSYAVKDVAWDFAEAGFLTAINVTLLIALYMDSNRYAQWILPFRDA